MNTFAANTAATHRPMVGQVECAKRNERIGQPDTTGTGAPAQE